MIEPIMYFGIGFLVAALIGLVAVALVHARAVRLTIRRLEAATPLSMAEIQADKDQLRAEFGMKGDAINQLKIELGEKTATILALEAHNEVLRDQLRTTEEEVAVKTSAMLEGQRALSDKEAELATLMSELDERNSLTDAQKVEIIALKMQVEALRKQLDGAGAELKAVADRRDAERVELKAATQELTEERGKAENLGRRVAELEQALVAQTTEAEILGRRAQDLENRLAEQMRLLNESEFELRQLRGELDHARNLETDLRTAIAELDGRTSSANQKLKSENAELQGELDYTKQDRDRVATELADLKHEAEQNWANERVENALLRES